MVIVVKDLHLKESEPYFSAQAAFLSWILSQEWNNSKNCLIQLGDLFNNSCPTPKEYNLAETFLSKVNFKTVYLLAGNHDWSDTKKTFSILPLQNIKNTKLILEKEIIEIEGKRCAFLPYKNKYREEYSEVSDDFTNTDLVFHHLEDETIAFGKNKQGINLSKWKGKRIGGHIHKSQKNYELGMPVQSRVDEKGQKNNLFCIDGNKESYISIPKFLDYYDVEYGEPLPKVEAQFPIWDIHNAPSPSEARKFYFGNYIRKVFIKNKKESSIEVDKVQSKKKTLIELFNEYISKRNDLSDSAINRLRTIISKK